MTLMSVLFALNNEVADSHVGFPFVAGTDRVVSVVHKLASGKSVNGLLFYSSAFELGAPSSCRRIMAFSTPVQGALGPCGKAAPPQDCTLCV